MLMVWFTKPRAEAVSMRIAPVFVPRMSSTMPMITATR
jgi:hypothetical protein